MTQFTLINPAACVEIGRTAVLAAELAPPALESPDVFDAIEAFVKASGLPREDAELLAYEAQHFATLLNALLRLSAPGFETLQRAGLASAEPDFADLLAETFAERFTDKALARVFLASVKLGVA